TSGPWRRYSSSPTLTMRTCGATADAHVAAVSTSSVSIATAMGAESAVMIGLSHRVPPDSPGVSSVRSCSQAHLPDGARSLSCAHHHDVRFPGQGASCAPWASLPRNVAPRGRGRASLGPPNPCHGNGPRGRTRSEESKRGGVKTERENRTELKEV